MTTALRLDRQALLTLFPEDSVDRVELTRAVASALIQKLAIKEIHMLNGQVKDEVKKVAREALDKDGITTTSSHLWNPKVELSEKTVQDIRDKAKAAVNDATSNALYEAIQKAAEEALTPERIERYVQLRLDALFGAALRGPNAIPMITGIFAALAEDARKAGK
jgi:hypothetical protein